MTMDDSEEKDGSVEESSPSDITPQRSEFQIRMSDSRSELQTIVSKGNLIKKTGRSKAKVWNHFLVYDRDPTHVNCTHCKEDINIGQSRSTSNMMNHLERRHVREHKAMVREKELNKLGGDGQLSMENFATVVKNETKAEDYIFKWLVRTYQPISTVENKDFRDMIVGLNKNASTRKLY